MAKLTTKQRSALPDSVFAGPGRSYPIPDKGHASFAIKVASIQHSKGKLSGAQMKAIHAKARRVLRAKDGGYVRSNMSDHFNRKAVERLADGGVVEPAQSYEDIGKNAGFPTTPSAPRYNYTAPAEPLPSVSPARTMDMSKANQGPKIDWAASARGLLQSTIPSMRYNAIQQQQYAPMIGTRGADGGMTEDITLRTAMRRGDFHSGAGAVRGPGGPKDDKVPALLSNGEFVVPADVVKKVGKENLDALVAEHHDFTPAKMANGGVARYADGSPPSLRTPYEPPPIEPVVQRGIPSAEAAQFVTERGPIAPGGGSPLPAPAAAAEAAPAAEGLLARAGRYATAGRNMVSGSIRAATSLPALAATPYLIGDKHEINDDTPSIGDAMLARAHQLFSGTALPSDREAGRESARKAITEGALDYGSGVAKIGDFAAGVVGAHPNLNDRFNARVQSDLGNSVTIGSRPAAPAPATIDNATGKVVNNGELQTTNDNGQVSLRGDRTTREQMMFSPEQRAAIRAARYSPTQYGPTIGDSNDEAFARLRGEFGRPAEGTWDRQFADRNARRVAAQERDIAQRERESLRSAGVQLSGQQQTAATARAQARLDQMNKDRQFSFDSAKAFGTDGTGTGGEVGRAEQRSREESDKAVHGKITNIIPPVVGPDGKPAPDTATAARYMTALNAKLGEKIAATEAHLQKNPGDAEAAAWLKKARSQGAAAIHDDDVRKLVAGMQAADLAQQEHSAINPIKGTAVTSDAPIETLRKRKGIIFDDYVSNRGDVIPARVVDKQGSILGIGGQRNANYDILKRQ